MAWSPDDVVKLFQVNFEHDKWFDVPLEQNQQIECSFCIPSNDACVVQVNSIFSLHVIVCSIVYSILSPLCT